MYFMKKQSCISRGTDSKKHGDNLKESVPLVFAVVINTTVSY